MKRFLTLALASAFLSSCMVGEEQRLNDPKFPLEPHLILPVWFHTNGGQIAAGAVTGKDRALEQPIPFSHYLHAKKNKMDCEYCHTAARKTIHGGAPTVDTCMNCHRFVKTGSPHVKKIKAAYDAGEPIQWQKVHDLPDYVYFAHNRHVNAGVQCTECHGQVQLQGQPSMVKQKVKDEEGHYVKDDEGHYKEEEVLTVEAVMVRETTLQMGWCLDCHAQHPSIDKNYGDQAGLRRAELKDCWTCHK
jgi:hypothetical protein